MPKFIINPDEKEQRLDVVVNSRYPQFSRAHIKNLIDEGKILLDGIKVKAGEKVKIAQVVDCAFDEIAPLDAVAQDVEFEIVYEDGDLLVINKPQGLVVHPCASTKQGTLVNGLLYRVKDLSGINGVLRPGIVHRLDKDTSGLMLVAKNDFAHVSLAKQIADKTCQRKYLALLEGNLKDDEGEFESFIERSKSDRKKMAVSNKGKFAITQYKVVKRFTNACLAEFTLKTGRTHQIRVHAKALGHPVVGDPVYGKAVKGLNGQLLHSYYISFTHPRTQKRMEFEISLPPHFENFLKNLKEK